MLFVLILAVNVSERKGTPCSLSSDYKIPSTAHIVLFLSVSCMDGTGMTKEDPEWEAERNPCRNVALQRKEEKLLFEAPSDVAGMKGVADPGCFSWIQIFSVPYIRIFSIPDPHKII